MILVLGYSLLGDICRYRIVLLLGGRYFFRFDTQYDTDQTAVSTIHDNHLDVCGTGTAVVIREGVKCSLYNGHHV